MPDPAAAPATTTLDTLSFARALRVRGEAAAAASVLDVALAQPVLQEPATAELAAETGWLHLERGDLFVDSGHLGDAGEHHLRALRCFEQGQEGAGAAVACLQLGDVAWQAGDTRSASTWWSRARSLADACGATPVAARALLALALRELGAGEPAVAEALIEAATDRAAHRHGAALDPEDPDAVAAAEEQTETVRASLALLRARRAISARNWTEARLLLSGAVEAARRLARAELYIDALRLDAVLARRSGDPRSAVESLRLAVAAADRIGAVRVAWLVQAELVLALADNEAWGEAFSLQEQEPPPEVAAQPGVHAARLEAFAVLALRAGRTDAAETALREALEVRTATGDAPGRARAQAVLADALLARGDLDAAEAAAAESERTARGAGRADLALDAALVTVRLALTRQVAHVADRAGELAEESTESGSVAQILAALDLHAAALLHELRPAEARAVAERADGLAASQPLVRLQARSKARCAQAILAGGDAAGAVRTAGEAAELALNSDDTQGRVRAMLVAGAALATLGRADEAALALGHAQQAALGAHRRDLAAEAACALGQGHATLQAWREARHAFAQAYEHAQQAGLPALRVRALRGLALCRRAEGDPATARQTLQAAQADAAAAGLVAEQAACVIDAAQIHVDAGEAAEARRLLEALGIAGEPNPQGLSAAVRGDARTLLGRIHAQAGERERAAQVLRLAVADLRTAMAPRSLGAALLLLGQVEGLLGNGEACGTLLGEALVVTAQHGLPEQAVVRQVIERIQQQGNPA